MSELDKIAQGAVARLRVEPLYDFEIETFIRTLQARTLEIAAQEIEKRYSESIFAEHSFIVRDLLTMADEMAKKGKP